MTSYDYFSNDARIFMNALMADKDPESVSRENIIKQIEFSKLASPQEAIGTYDEMLLILKSMSDLDWYGIRKLIPWDCMYATSEEDLEALEALNNSID